jgi:hypothetical protein
MVNAQGGNQQAMQQINVAQQQLTLQRTLFPMRYTAA